MQNLEKIGTWKLKILPKSNYLTPHKCTFVFYAEIQDGRRKWPENNFWEKLPDDSADTFGEKKLYQNHSHHFRDKCLLGFYVEIQDGPPKGRKNDFKTR